MADLKIPSSTDLAVTRTRLAHDRTLMAWLRTATALISFGFAIYKFFQAMAAEGKPHSERLFGPREFALTMIGIGVMSPVLAVIQHVRNMRRLRKQFGDVPYSLAGVVAGMIGLLGVLAFIAVILRR